MTGDPMNRPATKHWTYEDYVELPDDGTRCEIIEGKRLMTPAPWTRHQSASMRLAAALFVFVENRDLGVVLAAPFDVILATDTVVQPDIVVILKKHESRMKESGLFGAPDLAVEVLSPSTESRDRERKMRVYARHGVEEYWIVDPIAKRIEVYALDGRRFVKKAEHDSGEASSLVALPGFSVKLADVFKT
jgi:Uma2 family endonuclease